MSLGTVLEGGEEIKGLEYRSIWIHSPAMSSLPASPAAANPIPAGASSRR